MRRFKTLVILAFRLTSAVSLTAALALVALWVRSYRGQEIFSCAVRAGDVIALRFDQGKMFIEGRFYDLIAGTDELPKVQLRHSSTTMPAGWLAFPLSWKYAGFGYGKISSHPQIRKAELQKLKDYAATTQMFSAFGRDASQIKSRLDAARVKIQDMRNITTLQWIAFIPLWAIVAITAVIPSLHAIAIIRHRRKMRVGLCVVCGYDLRASPDRCPECGTPSTKPAEIQTPNRAEGSS